MSSNNCNSLNKLLQLDHKISNSNVNTSSPYENPPYHVVFELADDDDDDDAGNNNRSTEVKPATKSIIEPPRYREEEESQTISTSSGGDEGEVAPSSKNTRSAASSSSLGPGDEVASSDSSGSFTSSFLPVPLVEPQEENDWCEDNSNSKTLISSSSAPGSSCTPSTNAQTGAVPNSINSPSPITDDYHYTNFSFDETEGGEIANNSLYNENQETYCYDFHRHDEVLLIHQEGSQCNTAIGGYNPHQEEGWEDEKRSIAKQNKEANKNNYSPIELVAPSNIVPTTLAVPSTQNNNQQQEQPGQQVYEEAFVSPPEHSCLQHDLSVTSASSKAPEHQKSQTWTTVKVPQMIKQLQQSPFSYSPMANTTAMPYPGHKHGLMVTTPTPTAPASITSFNTGLIPQTFAMPPTPQIAPNMGMFLSDSNHQAGTRMIDKPKSLYKYRDFSRYPCSPPHPTADEQVDHNSPPSSTNGNELTFPVKLHKILSDPDNSKYISWLPHGRSWRILKPKEFEKEIVPKYFRHAKYASFMRQVNGWGYKRITQGTDHNSYYHELFLRGLPQLCYKMRRPVRTKVHLHDVDTSPDFYRMNLVAPLPGDGNDKISGTTTNSTNAPFFYRTKPEHAAQLSTLVSNSRSNNFRQTSNTQLVHHIQSQNNPIIYEAIPSAVATSINNHMVAQQPIQKVIKQNMNSHGQVAVMDTAMACALQTTNAAAIAASIPSNPSPEARQLDELRRRREQLVLQLQRSKAQASMEQGQSNESTVMINETNPMGIIHTIQTVQPPTITQFIPAGSQVQQMVTFGQNPQDQTISFVQIPACAQQVNATSEVGTTALGTQQTLMQPTNHGVMGCTFMNGNTVPQQVNQMGIALQNHQVSPNQRYQVHPHQFHNGQF